MTKIPNLEDLVSSPDTNASIIELDNFIGDLCEYGDDFSTLSEQQKLFYLNQNLEREVNNGGFNQYFCNSSGDNTYETIESLKAIKANKTVEILQAAIGQFPNSVVPTDRDERTSIVEQIKEVANQVWDELEQRFYKYEDDLNELNIAFVKANRKFF